MIIDCDRCTVRGRACANCVVTFISGTDTSRTGARRAPKATKATEGTEGTATTSDNTGTINNINTAGGDELELDAADIRALTVLANAGVIPPLRYAPAMAKAS